MEASQHICNRELLAAQLGDQTIAVINSNDIMPTNADGTMPFRQNSDLYWLTGIRQEETTLVLFPGHPDPRFREMLFIKQADEQFEKWNGKRLSQEEASDLAGITQVYWQSDLQALFCKYAVYASHIALNTIEHPRSVNEVQTRDDRFIRWCRERFPLHEYKRLAPVMGKLRSVKSEAEIRLLQKACDITEAGFRRVLRYVRPGVAEKQVEAELIHEYMQHGGTWAGYDPIVASGADSCILHYITNHKTCADGDLLLIDAAASYKGYHADLTRVIPVSGRFTPRQRQVYDAVLHVHQELKRYVRAGMYIADIQDRMERLLLEALLSLDLATVTDVRIHERSHFMSRYCYHSFGHYLGLDVHDVGNIYEPVPEGAVLTIEPGIYIREEGIGIRLENNVQVTKTGTVDLMKNIPIEAEEIEALMNEGR